jgi:hypothetical protein
MKSDSVVVFKKETPRGGGRITVTSSLNEISTDQLGNRLVMRNGWLLGPPPPLSNYSYTGQIFKDDVYGFSSISDICLTFVFVFTLNVICLLRRSSFTNILNVRRRILRKIPVITSVFPRTGTNKSLYLLRQGDRAC